MAEDLEQNIRENAQGPKWAQGDSGSVEQHDLKDQIEADRYLASKQAAKEGLGVRMTKVVPPGAGRRMAGQAAGSPAHARAQRARRRRR